jgi:hypothetical protein
MTTTTQSATIETFEDACAKLGVDPAALPDFSIMPEKHRKALLAHSKLILIAEALNDGWQPDWNNSGQWKYIPWFEIEASKEKPAGFGFSGTDADGWRAYTSVGSRLCFSSSDIAIYAGTQFADLYKDYFLID